MPKILVHKAFNLLLNSTSKLAFEPGLHDVTDDVAEHWYTKQHADVLGEGVAVTVDPNSDGRRAMIDRLVSLFRAHVETLDVVELAEMMAAAEAQLNADQTEAGEHQETAEPVETVEPPAEQPEPAQEGGASEAAETKQPVEAPVVESADPSVEPVATESAEAAPDFDPALVEAMTDDELRAYITERDGKAPHHKLGHEKLVALALAPAAGDTAEPVETEGGEA